MSKKSTYYNKINTDYLQIVKLIEAGSMKTHHLQFYSNWERKKTRPVSTRPHTPLNKVYFFPVYSTS